MNFCVDKLLIFSMVLKWYFHDDFSLIMKVKRMVIGKKSLR